MGGMGVGEVWGGVDGWYIVTGINHVISLVYLVVKSITTRANDNKNNSNLFLGQIQNTKNGLQALNSNLSTF